MRPPLVLIAANPYEGELCRKALADTGLRVEFAESIEGTLALAAVDLPLVMIIADGWYDADARELLVEVRSAHDKLQIFLLEDRDSDIADEDAAIRRGASRLFLRPIDVESLADAVEKLAVEQELAGEVSEQIEAQREEEPAESIELVADADDDWDQPSRPNGRTVMPASLGGESAARLVESPPLAEPAFEAVAKAVEPAARVEPMQVVGPVRVVEPPPAPMAVEESAAPADPQKLSRIPTHVTAADAPALPRVRTEVIGPPSMNDLAGLPATVKLPLGPLVSDLPHPPLLRADDALADAAGLALQTLVTTPELLVRVAGEAKRPVIEDRVSHQAAQFEDRRKGPPAGFEARSTFARRLDHELSEVERRLFPDSAPSANAARRTYDDYEDALGDIDLDSLGVDTLPGIAADKLDAVTERHGRRENGTQPVIAVDTRTSDATSPFLRLAHDRPPSTSEHAIDQPVQKPIDEEGSLAEHDLATLVCGLHAAGWTGRLQLVRGDGEKHVYFDAGVPVFATSSFVHDRLGDLLYREGKITREQHARTRELLVEPGRRTAALLIELGMLKTRELFPTLRRHVEEILYSCFGWESGSYRLGAEQVGPEERLRLSAHPWAIFLEGIRRKYGLERLVERVGPTETVLAPTTALERALEEGGLSSSERVVAELFDGERSIADLQLAINGLPGVALNETSLYALAWGLIAIGAMRAGEPDEGRVGVQAASTLVTHTSALGRERRRDGRELGDGAADRAIDRERLLAKRAQLMDSDYFSILGVDRHATPHEIQRAYDRLRLDFAPDRFAENLRAELAEAIDEIHSVLDEARRVLLDESVRHAYREHLLD